MIAPKRILFLAAIAITLLLIIGNWTIPAQATNTGIIGTTPTPTGTHFKNFDMPGSIAFKEKPDHPPAQGQINFSPA